MEKETTKRTSWFWKWFLNNQVVTGLLIVLLLLLITLVFTKVSYLFTPVGQFVGIVALPIILAGVFYYLINPVIDFLENRGVRRIYGIIGMFILIAGLIAWGIVVIIPSIRDQVQTFSSQLPNYIQTIDDKTTEVLTNPFFDQFRTQIEESADKMLSSVGDIVQNMSKSTLQGLGSVVATVANVLIALITAPIILFFLLKDGKQLAPYFLKFLPNRLRGPSATVLAEMNSQVSSYIRGQLTVAFAVAVMFVIGFSVVGLEYAVTLGILAGILNLVPYLGSFLAMIPVVFIALVAGPWMLVKVLIVFVIEQTIEGRLISPLVLSSQLKMHPVTILLVLLTAGKIFGVVGVILGIPVYAALKVVVTHIFEWYKEVSSLYQDEGEQRKPAPPAEEQMKTK